VRQRLRDAYTSTFEHSWITPSHSDGTEKEGMAR
jgi:hypothetical protein